MANTYLLSDGAKRYLCCYYQILDEMIQGVTTAKLTQSISHNLIVQLIPHHQAAIRMCRNLLEASDDRAVRRLAQGMAEQRTRTVQALEQILPAADQLTNPRPELRLCQRRMDLILREMFARMRSAPEGNRVDAVFLHQMLPHCRGAAQAARNTLRYELCTQLPPVLRGVLDAQCRDARRVEASLRRMGCSVAS